MVVAAPDARAIAASWLSALSEALSEKDIEAVTSLFLPNGWLRDVLVFGWDSHSLEGTVKISNYLKAVLPNAQLKNVALDERPFLAPRLFPATPDVSGIELAFTCETDLAVVRGMARLLPDAFEDSIWRALSVYIAIEDIKGHEEADHELGLYGGHTLVWGDVKDERRAEVERDPEVVISELNQYCHICA